MCHSNIKGHYAFMNETANENLARGNFMKFSISIYVVFFGSITLTLLLCARRERVKQANRDRQFHESLEAIQ